MRIIKFVKVSLIAGIMAIPDAGNISTSIREESSHWRSVRYADAGKRVRPSGSFRKAHIRLMQEDVTKN